MNEAIAEAPGTDCSSILTGRMITRGTQYIYLGSDEGSNGCVIVAEAYRKAEQKEIEYRQILAPRGHPRLPVSNFLFSPSHAHLSSCGQVWTTWIGFWSPTDKSSDLSALSASSPWSCRMLGVCFRVHSPTTPIFMELRALSSPYQ